MGLEQAIGLGQVHVAYFLFLSHMELTRFFFAVAVAVTFLFFTLFVLSALSDLLVRCSETPFVDFNLLTSSCVG